MIELLFVLLALSSAFVNENERLTASVFTFFTLCFYFVNMMLPDNIYYISAAGYDLLMMGVMYLLSGAENNKLTKYLGLSCMISIVIQLVGWRLYVIAGNGQIYDYMAIVFYVCIIILFLTRTKLNARFAGDHSYNSRFLRDHFRSA